MPFNRGPRICLGINLAWTELDLILALINRRFQFDVSQIVRSPDVDIDRDVILAMPLRESQGVPVRVSSCDDS